MNETPVDMDRSVKQPATPAAESSPGAGKSKGAPAVPEKPARRTEKNGSTGWHILSLLAWMIALLLVGVAFYLGYQKAGARAPFQAVDEAPAVIEMSTGPRPEDTASPEDITLPEFLPFTGLSDSISRQSSIHTIIPNRPSQTIQTYIVDTGDSIFEISRKFKITPETVLWANYKLLNDNPDTIAKGMSLNIPPINGVLYEWQAGDTFQSVAAHFQAKVEDILNWSGNNLDLTDPRVEKGTSIMIPGGKREFKQWVIPTIPRGSKSGVMASVYGAGACDVGSGGANGTGGFIFPSSNHQLTGNDYWGGHLGIDLGATEGSPIVAADSGVVVFAGWANGGYGYMVMIDHGNGYQTLYAHLSAVSVNCGSSVGKGQQIGAGGSTGNSTGSHLHFEVRYNGGFVSPWYVLPGA